VAGEQILEALKQQAQHTRRVNDTAIPAASPAVVSLAPSTNPGILDSIDPHARLKKRDYQRELARYQAELGDLAWRAYLQRRPVVAVFEGWDAAGKGSAIRRVTRGIDPRLYRVLQFAAPTDEERAHHYLWRFWRQLQRDGRGTFYDRSWYGRVLVERVEGFSSTKQWQRAYTEIIGFERQLVEHGAIVLKFWIHISRDEQEKRFEARESTPRKQHKLTQEDWRNREKWDEYEQAVNQMVERTSTPEAPWTLVAGNDKRHARVQILETFCRVIRNSLAP
jgi:polyphosphate kinase 2 (PPK2 family)